MEKYKSFITEEEDTDELYRLLEFHNTGADTRDVGEKEWSEVN